MQAAFMFFLCFSSSMFVVEVRFFCVREWLGEGVGKEGGDY